MNGAEESIRTFISLEVPERLKQEAGRLLKRLKAAGGNVSWAKASGLHLTIKFLGPVSSAMIPEIRETLENVVTANRFRIKVEGVGVFPDLANPRVIWLGTESDPALVSFQRELEAALKSLGFRAERRSFRPHLTLGRVRSTREAGALVRLLEKEASWSAGEWEFSEICLMKSELKPGGAVYTRLWCKTLP